jgi:hypothetical protein
MSELVERQQLVNSTQELTTEGKYQLKPGVRSWHEMVTSLRRHELGSREMSAMRNLCQATLVKTVKSLV